MTKISGMSKLLSFFLLIVLLLASACSKFDGISKNKVPTDYPIRGEDRARANVDKGKGLSIMGSINKKKNTNYEFSTSNPLWRATLETLDELPLSTVDYSGGVIITDWYSDSTSGGDSIKITVRFLSNEIRSDSLKIIVHNKKCVNNNCSVKKIDSRIQEKLIYSVVKKAASFEKASKEKK